MHELAHIDSPNKADENGTTLLMKAAKTGNKWALESLIKSGANVYSKDKDGWTALMYAVRYQNNVEIINSLFLRLFKIIFNGINLFFKGLYWLINKIDHTSSNFFKKCLKMASKVLYNNKS